MEKKGNLCRLVLVIILVIIFFTLFWLNSFNQKPWSPETIYINLSQTKVNDSYILTIEKIVPKEVDPSKYEWRIVDKRCIFKAGSNFPKKSGSEGTSINNSISITWIDPDDNKKFSKNDKIQIDGSLDNIEKPEFFLIDEDHIVKKIEIKI